MSIGVVNILILIWLTLPRQILTLILPIQVLCIGWCGIPRSLTYSYILFICEYKGTTIIHTNKYSCPQVIHGDVDKFIWWCGCGYVPLRGTGCGYGNNPLTQGSSKIPRVIILLVPLVVQELKSQVHKVLPEFFPKIPLIYGHKKTPIKGK